ncbi:MAG: rsrA [Acidimicrobiales bacterium]|nr:rsrA [Acidimicrobiales bacterium]
MPDCNDTLRELELFLDNELSESARQEIHGHLEGCPDCLQAFDFHAELRMVIAQKCRNDEMPAGLMAKIASCFGPDYGSDGAVEPVTDLADGPAVG